MASPMMKRYCILLAVLVSLSACLAPPLKPPATATARMRTIVVVPVESPPLEVIPDPIDTRLPVYRQNDDVPFDLFLERKIYRSPGGVTIAGLTSRQDIVPEAEPYRSAATAAQTKDLEPLGSLGEDWMPSIELARAAVSQLSRGGYGSTLAAHYRRLPMAADERSANLVRWRQAVRRWYNQDAATADYRSFGIGTDATVLEVGIGTYRILEAQTPLQALLKLIDPSTGRVIGRARIESFPVRGSAQTLLDHGAVGFKRLVAEVGGRLIARCLSDLGLSAPSPHGPAGERVAVGTTNP